MAHADMHNFDFELAHKERQFTLEYHGRPSQAWNRLHTSKQARKPIDFRFHILLTAFNNLGDARQGIVHVIGPELGLTQPGLTIACGDSHTSTHGAFGALAHGIGTSEVEHVLATQTLLAKKAKNMLVKVEGQVAKGVGAKDIVLAIIGKIGTAGGTGYTIEFAGSAIRALSMEGRMTVCNMAIEAGARAGLVAVDDTTIRYVQGRPFSPSGVELEQAIAYWRTLRSDPAVWGAQPYDLAAISAWTLSAVPTGTVLLSTMIL